MWPVNLIYFIDETLNDVTQVVRSRSFCGQFILRMGRDHLTKKFQHHKVRNKSHFHEGKLIFFSFFSIDPSYY